MKDIGARLGFLVSLAAMIACGAIEVAGGPWWAAVVLAVAAVTSFHIADR